jgi:hypothetical protein
MGLEGGGHPLLEGWGEGVGGGGGGGSLFVQWEDSPIGWGEEGEPLP